MLREIEAELLDHLPAEDARAVRSRGDLARINAVMMQPGLMARAIRTNAASEPTRIVDLGAGDGTFLLRVLRLLKLPGGEAALVDRQNIISPVTQAAMQNLGWRPQAIAADVFDYLDRAPPSDLICVNLFLHHLAERDLRRLFALAASKCNLLVACEPRRGGFPLLASRLLWAIGANAVTRHDAPASVRAGFSGSELSALWPDPGWHFEERAAGLFTHLFVARRAS